MYFTQLISILICYYYLIYNYNLLIYNNFNDFFYFYGHCRCHSSVNTSGGIGERRRSGYTSKCSCLYCGNSIRGWSRYACLHSLRIILLVTYSYLYVLLNFRLRFRNTTFSLQLILTTFIFWNLNRFLNTYNFIVVRILKHASIHQII